MLCVVHHLLVCTDHEIHTCARSYATLGWISWKSIHFTWKDDSPLWILCVSWCQSVTSTCYPRFKNMKWFWQDKHDSREVFSFYGKQLCLKNLDCLYDLHSPFDKPKTLNYIVYRIKLKNIVDIRSILGPAKIHSVDLLDICWTCSYPLSCTLTFWQLEAQPTEPVSLTWQ